MKAATILVYGLPSENNPPLKLDRDGLRTFATFDEMTMETAAISAEYDNGVDCDLFLRKVMELREAQKNYFKTSRDQPRAKQGYLFQSQALEKEIDALIRVIMSKPEQQTKMF